MRRATREEGHLRDRRGSGAPQRRCVRPPAGRRGRSRWPARCWVRHAEPSSTATTSRQVHRLHGHRHRRHRRQVVQPVRPGRACRQPRRANPSNIAVKYLPSATTSGLRQEHQHVHRREVRDHRHRRLPDGRGDRRPPRRPTRSQKFAIVDCSYASACLTGTKEPNIDQLVFNTVQDGFLGGYLAAGHDQDRQGGDLRRPEVPHGHDLHGRLLGRRAVLQQAAPHPRPGARLERADPERHLRRQLHQPDRGPDRSPTRSSTRARTSSSRWRAASGLGSAKAVQTADTRRQERHHDVGGHRRLRQRGARTASTSSPAWRRASRPSVKAAVLSAPPTARFKGGTYVGTSPTAAPCWRRSTTSPPRSPPSLQAELKTVQAGHHQRPIKPATKSPV